MSDEAIKVNSLSSLLMIKEMGKAFLKSLFLFIWVLSKSIL